VVWLVLDLDVGIGGCLISHVNHVLVVKQPEEFRCASCARQDSLVDLSCPNYLIF